MYKLKVGQLRQIAGANGIEVGGMRKAEIIELLKKADGERNLNGGVAEEEGEEEDDEVVVVDRQAAVGREAAGEAENVTLLRMKMHMNEQQIQINEQQLRLLE
jgi:hypothetical protein